MSTVVIIYSSIKNSLLDNNQVENHIYRYVILCLHNFSKLHELSYNTLN